MAEQVEILRDRWGIAHVYGDSEEAAFYGCGYAMAEDRIFQMVLRRRVVQGRVAEILGSGPGDRFVQQDRKSRIFAFHRRARETVTKLPTEIRCYLEAFTAGVNAFLLDRKGELDPLFHRYGGTPEPWSAADCIAIWDHLGQRFSFGWENEVPTTREAEEPLEVRPLLDDEAQICSAEDFKRSYPEVYERLRQQAAPETRPGAMSPPEAKLSHNWTVAGTRSTTGKPILESDPQYSVDNPSFWYEMHLCGGRYNVRGIGVPGAPGLLIGWNECIAWGVTGLGGDDADLFCEKLNPENGDQYAWQGQWREFVQRRETILVKDGPAVEMEIRQTHHGPIVDELLGEPQKDRVFALQHALWAVPKCSLGALLELMRATDWATFRQALSHYVGPPGHFIYADVEGNIGYQAATTTPKRRGDRTQPRTGWTGEDEWELLPFDELPSMLNPERNYIATANQLTAGSWYPYRVGSSIGGGPRSWRLRELFDADPERKFSPADFAAHIHKDSVCPAVRDLVDFALLALDDEDKADARIAEAVAVLQNWDRRLLVDSPAFPLARKVLDCLEEDFLQGSGLEERYPQKWAGVCALFNQVRRQVQQTGLLPDEPLVRQWLVNTFKKACYRRDQPLAPQADTTGWMRQVVELEEPAAETAAESAAYIRHMPYMGAPEGIGAERFGSFNPEADLLSPPLQCPLAQTIWSQEGNSYCQIVDLADIDRSLALLAPGISENPQSPHHADQVPIWATGGFREAPLGRTAVEAIAESAKFILYKK